MGFKLIALGLLTGLLTGAFFALFDVPIPAPPELPGLMGIVGIYLGYKAVQAAGVSLPVLESLGY
ncbi:XapX domain-containing protein [Natrialbaceae archaeon A-CW2]